MKGILGCLISRHSGFLFQNIICFILENKCDKTRTKHFTFKSTMLCFWFIFCTTLKIINLVCIFIWLVVFGFILFCSRNKGTGRLPENKNKYSQFSCLNWRFCWVWVFGFFLKCFLSERRTLYFKWFSIFLGNPNVF